MTMVLPGANTVSIFFDLGDTLVTADKHWIAGAEEALRALHAKGVRLGILSNTGPLDRAHLASFLPPDFDFTLFEPELVVLSREVGLEKPDPRIFRLALQRAGTGAAAFFCTEDMGHTIVAQRAGLVVLRVAPPPASDVARLPEILAEAGVLT
jgi:FMN phosphatase YigB (HAD superfamily)